MRSMERRCFGGSGLSSAYTRMFVSKKLRTGIIFSRMNLVPVELPAARVALTGEALELFDATLGVVSADDGLQVVADELVQAFARRLGFFARAGTELVIQRERSIHFAGLDTVYVDTGYVSIPKSAQGAILTSKFFAMRILRGISC